MPDLAVILLDLGIVGFLVGAAVAWKRLQFVCDRSSFRCRLAFLSSPVTSRHESRWTRLTTRAKWTGDVLVIQVGPLWAQTLRLPVHLPLDTQIHDQPRGVVRRLGAHPQSLVIPHEGCTALVVAVRAKDRTRLVGPFLAAAVAGLPSAPRSDRRRKL